MPTKLQPRQAETRDRVAPFGGPGPRSASRLSLLTLVKLGRSEIPLGSVNEYRTGLRGLRHHGKDDPVLRSIGLIEAPARTEAGYRVYGAQEIHALRFIKRARNLGFSVEEMRELLALWRDRSRASADVKALAIQHVRDLDAKIAELQAMSRSLRHLAEACQGDARPDCPILDDLAAPT